MMKRFFYPRKLLYCVYCPKLGKRFIKVGQTRFPEPLPLQNARRSPLKIDRLRHRDTSCFTDTQTPV